MDIEELAQKIRNRISWNLNLDEMTLFEIKQIVKDVLDDWVDEDSVIEYDDEAT
jgi:hypothetical protein